MPIRTIRGSTPVSYLYFSGFFNFLFFCFILKKSNHRIKHHLSNLSGTIHKFTLVGDLCKKRALEIFDPCKGPLKKITTNFNRLFYGVDP